MQQQALRTSAGPESPFKYKWFAAGDLNGFVGLAFDNLAVLSFLSGILIVGFQFPAEVVYRRMFPGTAMGVLLGNFAYAWLAVRLARRNKNPLVTAMPLGLDTPSTIGIALTVLGPAFTDLKSSGMGPESAAVGAWHIGVALMIFMGILKFVLSFAGGAIQRAIPRAGLLGSLAGVGLCLVGFIPIVEICGAPIVGVPALCIVLYALVARLPMPGKLPGVAAAAVVGSTLYYALIPLGVTGGTSSHLFRLQLAFPLPTLGFAEGVVPALKYLPIAIPFALLTVVGGINVTESARAAGDDFKVRDVLLIEAGATIIAAVCGGVAQTTPYIGQPAYKRMGSRTGYTILTGIFIGLGGVLGYCGFMVELIPRAVIAPILVFVALDIVCQAFQSCPQRYGPAVAIAFFPSVARLLQIKFSNPDFVAPEHFQHLLESSGKGFPELLATVVLGNGFIITGMLWGGFLAELIDGRVRVAAGYLLACGCLSLFGVIHSALPEGTLYLPWSLPESLRRVPIQFAASYAGMAMLLLAIPRRRLDFEKPK